MRQLRLRLRSSLIFLLTALTLGFILIFNALISSTVELNPLAAPLPVESPPLWSAFHQSNIYDLHALPAKKKKRVSATNNEQIDRLYQLVRSGREEKRPSSINSTWSLEKFLVRSSTSIISNDTLPRPESAESPSSTRPLKSMNEVDQRELRAFLLRRLQRWKDEHLKDPLITLAEIMHDSLAQDEPTRLNTSWYQYMKTVSNQRIYEPRSPQFQQLRQYLQHAKIEQAGEMSQGTQIKVLLDFSDGFQGLMKPYRVPRNYQTQPDHFYFSDIERHHAEIAAFHLDKILGFYRVPPLVGRVLNITGDLRAKATDELGKTFFISPANNTCFRGHCSYYCDTSHAVCGKPGDRLEASVQVLLPRPPEVDWQKLSHPYRRSYSSVRQATWESNENYCYERVMIDEDYHGRLLLDMMDLSAFDFLTGNLDRHHMMKITSFGLNTALIHLDNGRSFGRYESDDLSILSPIRQCCFFRSSTFARLYRLSRQGLSKLLAESLRSSEQLPTILIDEHLEAVDRRLEILFAQLERCVRTHGVHGVIVDDGIE